MTAFTEQSHLDEALRRLRNTEDPRLKQVMEAFTRHMFAFVNEVRPTEDEWMRGIRFLTDLGKMCNDVRQEWILFSDAFGVTMLVDYINHQKEAGTTESSVLGPFYRDGAPEYDNGDSISQDGEGEPIAISGTVTDSAGNPIAGAKVDIWQTAPNGLYEVQDEGQPDYNLRGGFTTDAAGRYEAHSVKPVSYPIPDDGPVGQLLRAVGRHPYRPAHVHFIVSAEGYQSVVTQLFTDDDPYLDSDAVFGVKDSLVIHYTPEGDGYRVGYDFALKKAT
jgi:catechol 1,2-dioxygenase